MCRQREQVERIQRQVGKFRVKITLTAVYDPETARQIRDHVLDYMLLQVRCTDRQPDIGGPDVRAPGPVPPSDRRR